MRKICANCKYFYENDGGMAGALCRHPEARHIVYGFPTTCEENRNGDCGMEATRFEQKPPRKPWLSGFRFRLTKED